MVVRFTDNAQLDKARSKCYEDAVFDLINEQLASLLTGKGLNLFELYATADAFTQSLITLKIKRPAFVGYEVDRLKSELEYAEDLPLILVVCYYKMLALLPTTPTTTTGLAGSAMASTAGSGLPKATTAVAAGTGGTAGTGGSVGTVLEESPLQLTQKAYFAYFQRNKQHVELLEHFEGCEETVRNMWKQEGEDYKYDLLELAINEDENLDKEKELIRTMIADRDSLTISDLQTNELIIRRASAKYKGAFDEMAAELQQYIAERMRMEMGYVHVTGDYVVQKQIDKQVNGVANNGVGISVNPAN